MILGVFVAMALIAVLIISSFPPKAAVFFSTGELQAIESTPPMRRVAFHVTNTASRPVFLQVAAIETNSGSAWMPDTQALPANTFRTLGRVGANETARLSIGLPQEPVRSRLRVLASPDATTVQKVRFALRRLFANLRGQGNHKQLWFDKLAIPTYEVVTPEIP